MGTAACRCRGRRPAIRACPRDAGGRPAAWTRRSAWPVRGERFPAVPPWSPAEALRKQTVAADSAAVKPAGRLRTICHVQPGQWLVEGISFYAGSALRWLRIKGSGIKGSGIKGLGPPAGCRRATPGWSSWRRRCCRSMRPHRALAPADAWTWAHGSRPSRPGRRPGRGEQARAIQEAAAYSTRLTAGLISEMLGLGAWPTVILTGRGGPEHALAGQSRRRARRPGQRAGSRGVRGPRRRRPGRPAPPGCCPAPGGRSAGSGPGEPGPRRWRTRARPGSGPTTCSMNGLGYVVGHEAAYRPSFVTTVGSFTFAKIVSCVTRGMPSQIAM